MLTAALPVLAVSCVTSSQPLTYHATDNAALIVRSLDNSSCQVLAPTPVSREANASLLDQAKTFPRHGTAVVILENYSEPQLGREFRDRTLGWFIGLRGLGYQRIVFLRGSNMTSPDGLLTLAEYD